MPEITCAAVPISGAPDLNVFLGTLRHLGRLLSDVLSLSVTDRFAVLLAKLDAAATGGALDTEVRAGLLRLMSNLHRYAISLIPSSCVGTSRRRTPVPS